MGRRGRVRGRLVSGILLLDKPLGLSSNQALQRVKRLYDARKAGHTGSLDPLADGMLPICFGDATKLSAYLLDKVQVVTVPGIEFGLEGYLRLSYCGTIKDITEGIERIKWALDPHSPNELYIGDRKLVRDWT